MSISRTREALTAILRITLFLALVLLPVIAAAGNSDKETAAVGAARKWLALVDGGDYAQSWEEGADYFKNAVPREQWQQSMTAVRKPLGGPLSRTVKGKQYATSLPGAPDGEYVVIHFRTSFTNKKSTIETVTPMLEKDGRWRVSGYFIK